MYIIYLEEVSSLPLALLLNLDRRHPMCSVSTLTNTPPQQHPTNTPPSTPHRQHPTNTPPQVYISHTDTCFFTILNISEIHVYLSDIILELKQVRVVFTLLFL